MDEVKEEVRPLTEEVPVPPDAGLTPEDAQPIAKEAYGTIQPEPQPQDDVALKALSQKQRARTEIKMQQDAARASRPVVIKNKFKNETCYCGSLVKYKNCCMAKDRVHNFQIEKAAKAAAKAAKK